MMRFYRVSSLNSDVLKAIALVCLADGLVGISYGSLAHSYGFPLWVPLSLSLLVLAGASEFIFIGMVAGGASPLAAAAAGMLVNARHLPFGIAVRDLVGGGQRSWLGCHIMNDESVVFGLAQSSPSQRKAAYWLCGLGIALCWPLGVLLGTSLGQLIPDINAIGLDAVFPAILLALIFSALKKLTTLISASAGALIALASVPLLPVGMPVLFSLLGLLVRRRQQ